MGNLAIAWDYIDQGRANGEPVGSTGRYIAAHPDRNFYLVAEEGSPYNYFFSRGTKDTRQWWKGWVGRFKEDVALRDVVRPARLESLNPQRPFGLLMNVELWNDIAPELQQTYVQERVRIREVTPDGRLVVFEVPTT